MLARHPSFDRLPAAISQQPRTIQNLDIEIKIARELAKRFFKNATVVHVTSKEIRISSSTGSIHPQLVAGLLRGATTGHTNNDGSITIMHNELEKIYIQASWLGKISIRVPGSQDYAMQIAA